MTRDPHPPDRPGLSDSGPSPPFPQNFRRGKGVIWAGMLCPFQECRIRGRDHACGRAAWDTALTWDYRFEGYPSGGMTDVIFLMVMRKKAGSDAGFP